MDNDSKANGKTAPSKLLGQLVLATEHQQQVPGQLSDPLEHYLNNLKQV